MKNTQQYCDCCGERVMSFTYSMTIDEAERGRIVLDLCRGCSTKLYTDFDIKKKAVADKNKEPWPWPAAQSSERGEG